ncbi:MAG: hypothetical protein AMXMBFR64_52420 [Myxococcales bacterium]
MSRFSARSVVVLVGLSWLGCSAQDDPAAGSDVSSVDVTTAEPSGSPSFGGMGEDAGGFGGGADVGPGVDVGGAGGAGGDLDGGTSGSPTADSTTGGATDSGPSAPDAAADAKAGPDGDKVTPWDDPDAQCGYGTIYGLICSISDQTFVDGATVWVETTDCDGNPIVVETTSDGDGYYTLEGVPNGMQTVQIKRDDFEKTHTVVVKAGKVTDVTGVGHKECFQNTGTCVPGKQNINVEAKQITGIADVVWFIDTSGSMDEEAKYLQENINGFANYIANQAVDAHVVLIAKGFDICVPPPLGGPDCTDGPNFRHVHESVDSTNGLEKVIETYPLYEDFLQEGATTNFIAVTDDNSKKSAAWFNTEVAKKPAYSSPFRFHSIIGMGTFPIVGCIGAAQRGSVYLQLSAQTGGATFPICNKDWSAIFADMAKSVIDSLQTTCGYAVPNPAALNKAKSVSLKHDGGGFYQQVGGPAECGTTPAWYLVGQDQLFLCPSSCSIIKSGVLELKVTCD